jgi:hypothetical protein
MTIKLCKECNKSKDITQFSKRKASSDGLQPKCKQCNSKDNLQFRTEKPEHHEQWQKINQKRATEITYKWRRADKSGKIYCISNPNGECYIGMTKAYLSVRMLEHRLHYRRRHGALPTLHQSFDKFGFENHKVDILLELDGIDRTQLRFIEKSFIEVYKQKGISLNTLK